MTDDALYSAFIAHDRRFDGVFFVGVASTGVYCRPICNARIPARKQCSFFFAPAAAEQAGFRPCLLCRPERAPGTYLAIDNHKQQIHQIATYIDETLLIDETLESVAQRHNISTRHLRRLFTEVFGVETRHYLTTKRLLFAKQLLQDTSLPVDQVAYASGFGSVGRLHVQMKRAYQLTPAKFRQKTTKKQPTASIFLRTDYRPPFAWAEILAFLNGRATPFEWVDESSYHRIIDSFEIIVTNDSTKKCLIVQIPQELVSQSYKILARVRHMFDLSAQPILIARHLSSDPILKKTITLYPGLRVPGCWDDFEMLIRVIIGQQISVAGATTVMRRLVDTIGISPAAIANSSPDAIAKIGMPFKRAVTIWTIGTLVQSNQLHLDERNPKKFYDSLVAIPGIGPWTAEYVSMRIQKWPDAFPAGDLGLQKAAWPGRRMTEKELRIHAETWRPWRSYATILLWQSLNNNGG